MCFLQFWEVSLHLLLGTDDALKDDFNRDLHMAENLVYLAKYFLTELLLLLLRMPFPRTSKLALAQDQPSLNFFYNIQVNGGKLDVLQWFL